jgi:hypothetical protein
MIFAQVGSAVAQTSNDEQQRLFEQMVRQPTNYEITSAYVRVATANGDYEAAIGALERLLYYNPNLARVKYELGTLYYRLNAYEVAKRYFREAQASPDLDEGIKQSIATYLAEGDKQTQQSRFSGFAQTGLRYQSNANFGPSSGITRFGGADLAVGDNAKRAPDGNWFGVLGLSHDYDLENEHGDVLETRFVGYDSQQFHFHDLDVGLFDISFGPRMPLGWDMLPGASIKPYVVGGSTWVGTTRYLTTGGTGVQLRVPLGPRLTITPEFEWRNASYNNDEPTPTATFASGNVFTGALTASLALTDQIKFESRALARRGLAGADFQTYDQVGGEAAFVFLFPSPIRSFSTSWSVSPFARYLRTEFDAANPYIDALTVRTDDQETVGMTFNAPVNNAFGISTTVQYDHIASTLPNYRVDNFSVMVGPTARF